MGTIGIILFLAGVWCLFYTFTGSKGYSDAAKSEHDQRTNLTCFLAFLFMIIGGSIIEVIIN